MRQGFVYVLLNPSFPDQVKIGLTERASEIRARDLFTTGLPTPFIVIYDELVSDCRAVERNVHERFAGYRVTDSREFFRVPVREAVRVLQEEARLYRLERQALPNRKDILHALTQKYAAYLKPDIVSAAIVQSEDVCFLEIIRRPYQHLRDEIVERLDLSFISGDRGTMFPLNSSVEENANRFIHDLDEYSLIMTTQLFTEEACRQIATEWEQPGGKLDDTRHRNK